MAGEMLNSLLSELCSASSSLLFSSTAETEKSSLSCPPPMRRRCLPLHPPQSYAQPVRHAQQLHQSYAGLLRRSRRPPRMRWRRCTPCPRRRRRRWMASFRPHHPCWLDGMVSLGTYLTWGSCMVVCPGSEGDTRSDNASANHVK